MSRVVEKILAEINNLTPDEQRELRALLEQHQNSPAPRTAQLVSEVKGKYSFVPTSSEAFAARKAEEIELEDRRSKRP
jgi:hypothetical protein